MGAPTPWGGRFESAPDAALQEYGASIMIDQALWKEDIAGSKAHASMLAKQGILSQEDADAICSGLDQVAAEIEAGTFVFKVEDEDIHMAVEKRLTELVGTAGKRLHTGRSRNDQVACDTRLHAKNLALNLREAVKGCMEVLLSKAEQNSELIMPGYTHLQRAQPVLVAHHLLAYFWMLERDYKRLTFALEAADVNPLGSAALAGTSYPLDRFYTTAELGFSRPTYNSLDAVSDRDFVCDLIYACSLIQVHLSRLCEEIILWSSGEFGFVRLSDSYSTGSSIMPQKKNPDFAELTRGKTGRVLGDLMGMFTVLKGLPLAYNKDMQEDKEFLLDAAHTVEAALKVCAGMVDTLEFCPDALQQASQGGFMAATDLADHLVTLGLPFREAHAVVGALVLYAEKDGRTLQELSLDELKAQCELFDDEALKVLDIAQVVAARTSFGGTAPQAVAQQMEYAKATLATLGE